MKYFLLTTLLFGSTFRIAAQDLGWAARLGGLNTDHAFAVITDDAGNVYATGSFEGTADFDPGTDTAHLTSAGDADVFVTKLDADGHLVWAIRLGGPTEDYGIALALNDEGQLYVSGYFNGTSDFDPGPDTFALTATGDYDGFLVKFDTDGQFLWAEHLGGMSSDHVNAMALDTAGHILLTGFFYGTADFDPGTDTFNLTSNGNGDVFITKLDDTGAFIWARQLGSNDHDLAHSITVDPDNQILTTGRFFETVDFDPGAGTMNLTSNGMGDAFVLKLDEAGEFIWAVHFGAENTDEVLSIHTDSAGRIYMTGFFVGTVDFDPGPDTLEFVSSGIEDIFISVLDAGGTLIMAWPLGGPGSDKGHAIDVDAYGNIYASGIFSDGADFDPDTTEVVLSAAGGVDAFVVRLSADGDYDWVAQLGGPGDDRSVDMVVDASQRVYTSGHFMGTADFDPGADTLNLTSEGSTDVFVVVLTQCIPTFAEINPTACESYTSPDGLETWTVSGTYMDTLVNAAGCDSVITVQLTIANSTTADLTETACDSYTSPDGMETWTVSGTYQDTIANAAGCDSVITVELTILNSTAFGIIAEACNSYTSPDGEETWTVSGIYQDTLVNAAGCDSVITVQLTINSSASEIFETVCDSFISPDGMETWTVSGTYQDTLVNAVGCDSVITIQLTILNSTLSEITAEACDSYPSPSGQHLWTVSGIYLDTIPNAAGCDSIITIDLTIHQNTVAILDITSCDSLVSPSGLVWTASGMYQDIIANAAGCDSFMTINLTIVTGSASEITVEACGSYTLPGGTQTWNESGTYQDIIPNAAGCDSVVTVNLTINASPSSEITTEACESYTSPSGTQTWTASGTYQDTIPLAGECDSIITVHLTILEPSSSESALTVCDSYILPDGQEVTQSGTYLSTLVNAEGCDSVVTLQLTVVQSTSSTNFITACDRYTSPGGTQTWTASGVYSDVIPNAAGCDSVITIDLTILTSTAGDLMASACGSFLSPSTNYQWTESGIYQDTISNASGCDSVITIDLTIINIDTAVSQSEAVLTALMDGATYQWIDCDNGNLPIAGETGQQFTATANGHYAVIVSFGGCSDTSACYAVTTVGTKDLPVLHDLRLYPNPTRGHFILEPGSRTGEGVITISDLQGRELYRAAYRGENRVEVPFNGAEGIYLVALTGNEVRSLNWIIIQ